MTIIIPYFNVHVTFKYCARCYERGKLGVAEQRITAEKFGKYRNTAKKKKKKYRNFIENLYSCRIRWREGKNRGKNKRWDRANNDTVLN